jgi:glycerophosphoryl diester phosphodiesterase
MNFTREDYLQLRVNFSVKVDPKELSLVSRLQVSNEHEVDDRIVVGVVGGCNELGCWDPYRSFLLSCTKAHPHVWTGSTLIQTQVTSPTSPPSNIVANDFSSSLPPQVIEYKYVIFERTPLEEQEDDHTMRLDSWEAIAENRKLVVPLDVLSVVIDDGDFGCIGGDRTHRKLFIDEGWLNDPNKMELRINIGTYQKYGTTPIKLYTTDLQNTPFAIQCYLIDYPTRHRKRKRFGETLSRWVYDSSSDKVGRPEIKHNDTDRWIDGDIIICSIATTRMENKAIEIDIVTVDGMNSEILGKAMIIPQMVLPPMYNREQNSKLNNRNGGHLNLPIMGVNGSEMTIIGELNCNYLCIRPFIHAENNLCNISRTRWDNQDRTLQIGHRGMGRSYDQVAPYPKAILTENTIISLVSAAKNGADFVEFDVHLTKDYIPVIYHDLSFNVELKRSMPTGGHMGYKEPLELRVNELTLEQLRRVKTHPIPKHKHLFQNLVRDHWDVILKNMKRNPTIESEEKPILPDSNGFIKFKQILSEVPTLEEALKAVPMDVGFNIEIKYPETTIGKITFYEMNFFVDSILSVIFSHAGTRRIVISCFDPDVCTAVRLKQPRYPVFFLTSGGHEELLEDVRCNSVESALLFAKSERLLGIVPCSTPLLQNIYLIDKIKQEGLILITWGDDNNVKENRQIQKEHGVNAVIYDNIENVHLV